MSYTLLKIITLLGIVLNLFVGFHGKISLINIFCGFYLIGMALYYDLYDLGRFFK